ncbi:hypothetical protein [Stackebrandtia soli]|uniref:hypothetical protein n=1 Tax=Stackebrandtia soli TaxID=1892856 RepID=UPI0039EBF8A5
MTDRDVAACVELAHIARILLRTNAAAKNAIANLMAAPLPPEDIAFVAQLITRIPLGPSEIVVATARAMQLAGIASCIADDLPLSVCPCYRDILDSEVKPMLTRLLRAAEGDWADLGSLSA